ncbi:MAG: YtcP3 [Clostridiales bacterium]|jgi:putative aldouronate transport system permease protein|nr:YtcP3 [Clostridiales bacterium]
MVRDKSLFNTVIDVLIYSVLFVYAVVSFLPFVYVTSSSFSKTPSILPKEFTLEAYKYIFSTSVFVKSMGISIYITIFGTLISLFFTVLMAYALADKQLPGRKIFTLLVVFTMLFGGGMIPTYFVVKQTGMLNSIWSLIIPSAISPFNLIVLKNFIQSLPEELKESARIDGCHELIIVFKIIIPLSLPAMAAFGLFYAVGKWNTYFSALLYIQDSRKWPIQVLLRQVIYSVASIGDSAGGEDQRIAISSSVKNAVIIVSTLPILLVYPFLQKHFAKGMLLGSVKG